MNPACESGGVPTDSSTENHPKAAKPSGHPFVSIILCTSGLRPILTRCLELLVTQTKDYGNSEIIVVLNGPQNQAFAQAVSQFPVRLLHEPRRGVSIARNHAVHYAKGDILVFVDDDILIDPDWLDKLLVGFEDSAVACVTGRVIPAGPLYISTERRVRYYSSKRALSNWTLDNTNPNWYQQLLGEPVGFGCNMAFRKDFLLNYSPFPVDLGAGSLIGSGDEFYMYIQVLKHGFRIRHTPDAAVTHFFDEDVGKQKARSAQLHTGNVAFALKLLLEEKTLRPATIRWVFAGLKRRFRHILRRRTITSEEAELLSPREKVSAYLRGVSIYWKSRHIVNSTSHSLGQTAENEPPR